MAAKGYTSEALGKKYTTPYTGAEAGKNIILNEVHAMLCLSETGGDLAMPLFDEYDMYNVMESIKTDMQEAMYERYLHLAQWATHTRNYMKDFASTARALCFYHLEMTSSTIHGELIAQELTEQGIMTSAEGEKLETTKYSLAKKGLSRFTEGQSDRFNAKETWHTIHSTLNTFHAFNTAIELIAQEIQIPEFEAYCMDISPDAQIQKLISVMRENLASLESIVDGSERIYSESEIASKKEALSFLHSLYDAEIEPSSDKAIASAKKKIRKLAAFASLDNDLITTLLPTSN